MDTTLAEGSLGVEDERLKLVSNAPVANEQQLLRWKKLKDTAPNLSTQFPWQSISTPEIKQVGSPKHSATEQRLSLHPI